MAPPGFWGRFAYCGGGSDIKDDCLQSFINLFAISAV